MELIYCFIYSTLYAVCKKACVDKYTPYVHTINLDGKAYIMQVDYETTLGTTVLENIVVRNRKKHSHNKVFYNYQGSLNQADHSSKRSQYSHMFFNLSSSFSCGNLRKPL